MIERLKQVRRLWTGSAKVLAAMRRSLLWMLLSRQRRRVRWVIVLFFVQVFWQIQIANATIALVDRAIVDQALPITPYVWLIFRLALIGFAIGFATRQLSARLAYEIEFDLRTWLYTRVQWADLRKLDQVASGQLVTRSMTDLNMVQRILRFLPIIVSLLPITLGLILYLAWLSPPLAVISAGALPFNIWILRKFRKRLWALSWAELNERAQVTTAIDEPVRGVRVMRAFGREDHERARLAQTALHTYRLSLTRVRLLARYDILMKAVPLTVHALVLVVGARLITAGTLTLGVFLIAFGVAGGVSQIAQIFDELASAWQYLRSAQARLGELLAMGDRPQEGRQAAKDFGGVELRAVGVNLAGNQVFSGLSFAARPGDLVVVSGPPGSGKTTVANLIGGLVAQNEGEVLLDGRPLSELDITTIRTMVRVVSEEPMLFSGSVRQNLDLGAAWLVSDEAIHAAIRAAGAEDIVRDMPEGLDTHVGDRGLTLSGGQRQRLALARALVARPRVIVLDDALSAVDPAHEVEILGRLQAFLPDSAVICISRRRGPATVATSVVQLSPRSLAAATEAAAIATPGVTGSDLMDLVQSLKVSDERPIVPDSECEVDRMPRVRTLIRLTAGSVIAVVVFLAINSLGQIGPEILFGTATDAAERGDTRLTDLIGLAVIGVAVVYAVSGYFLKISAMKVAQSIVYLLRRRIFHRLTKLGIDFYDREMPGEVATRVVNDLDMILQFVAQRSYRFLVSLGTFAIAMGAVIAVAPPVTTTIIGLVAVVIALTTGQLFIGLRAYNRVRDDLGRVVSTFEEHFFGRAELRGCGAMEKANRRFVEEAWTLRRSRRWAMSVANFYSELMQVMTHLGGALILASAGRSVLAIALPVGAALSARLLSEQALRPLPQMGDVFLEVLEAKVSWDRLRQPFDMPILPVERPGALPAPRFGGDVSFESVAFEYPDTNRQVLHDVSFAIPAGTVAALVGFTGAGKSSITKLLTRMYDPQGGRVLVDGIDIRTFDTGSYRARLGIVPQDAFLFKGTVASNIAYARPDASLSDVEEAARAVGAHVVLEALERGYDHIVEEEGRNLTAAQRQLVALARVWLARPDILVLDEATSSLDGPLEDFVLDAVRTLGITTLTVTHRDNVVRKSDVAIVLDGGRVVATGAPDELIGKGTAYDRLWVAADEPELVGVGATAVSTNGPARRARRRRAGSEPSTARADRNGARRSDA